MGKSLKLKRKFSLLYLIHLFYSRNNAYHYQKLAFIPLLKIEV